MKTKVLTIYGLAILAGVMLFCVCPVQAEVWTSGHHEIFDGEVHGEIYIYNDVTLDILGGDIGRLTAYDTTVTNWYDGTMIRLWTRDNSIVNIYGGSLDFLWSAENSFVNLYAYDAIVMNTGGWYDQGYVTGKFFSNDEPFYFDLSQDSYLHINIVPEPASIFLLSLGYMFLRKND